MKRAATLLLAALLSIAAATAQESDARARGLATGALLRDPTELPHSKPGRWADWDAKQPPPQELVQPLRDAVREYFAGDYALAAQGFFALLEREPDFPPALYQLGVTYFRLRRYGDCARTLERFLAVAPKEIGATQGLAHSYYSLGDYARAEQHYTAVIEANPESAEAVRGLALTEMRLGRLERALELLERCLALKPGHVEATYWKARVLFDLGRVDQARAAAEEARALDPYDPRPHFLLSQLLYDLGEDEAAAASEARFLELNLVVQKVRTLEGMVLEEPKRAEHYARLVEVHASIGNVAGARGALERWMRAQPGELGPRVAAMNRLAELGDKAAAEQVAEGVERDFAEVPEAWLELRRFWNSVGDLVREVRAGERYLRLGGDPNR
jgi:tetratricopeptide (TPR) repeat protein